MVKSGIIIARKAVRDNTVCQAEKAIKNARAIGNPAIIDAFHDALVDELYDHLIERRKLQKL